MSGGHFLQHFYILAFPPLFPFLRRGFALANVEPGLIVSVIQAGTFPQVFAGDVDVWTGFWLIGVSFVVAAGIAAAIGTGRVGRAATVVGGG